MSEIDYDKVKNMLWGHYVGDVMGSITEFKPKNSFPKIRDIEVSKVWNTYLGQGTDDSEMTMVLLRYLQTVDENTFDINALKKEYVNWLNSNPFDIGVTTLNGIRGKPSIDSLSNGALMRIAPLAIWAFNFDNETTFNFVKQVVNITHLNTKVEQICFAYVLILKQIIAKKCFGFDYVIKKSINVVRKIFNDNYMIGLTERYSYNPPQDYYNQMGFIETAYGNMIYHMFKQYNNISYEKIILDTINEGGDADTNAAIVGAVAGVIHKNIPINWLTPCMEWWQPNGNFTSKQIEERNKRSGIKRPLEYTSKVIMDFI